MKKVRQNTPIDVTEQFAADLIRANSGLAGYVGCCGACVVVVRRVIAELHKHGNHGYQHENHAEQQHHRVNIGWLLTRPVTR
jgi:hypothetical protein